MLKANNVNQNSNLLLYKNSYQKLLISYSENLSISMFMLNNVQIKITSQF